MNRRDAAKHVKSDTREQPKLQTSIASRDVRLLCPPGGLIMFSGAHLHETVPNTSGLARYSIDFRTVHLDDVAAHKGAGNVNSRCTGTTMGDYLRCSDLGHLPAEMIETYDRGTRGARRTAGPAG